MAPIKETDTDSIDDVEYPLITDIMMKDEILMETPVVNRANKTNALRIYDRNRNVDDVINERNKLSDEHCKTNQRLKDTEQIFKNSQNSEESEEHHRLNYYKLLELEAEKKTQVRTHTQKCLHKICN